MNIHAEEEKKWERMQREKEEERRKREEEIKQRKEMKQRNHAHSISNAEGTIVPLLICYILENGSAVGEMSQRMSSVKIGTL